MHKILLKTYSWDLYWYSPHFKAILFLSCNLPLRANKTLVEDQGPLDLKLERAVQWAVPFSLYKRNLEHPASLGIRHHLKSLKCEKQRQFQSWLPLIARAQPASQFQMSASIWKFSTCSFPFPSNIG